MDKHGCCWDEHTCDGKVVALAELVAHGKTSRYMALCADHLAVIRRRAAIRDIDVITMRPNKAMGGQ